MTETTTTTTTLTGWKMWTVIGVVIFIGLLIAFGCFSPEARPYIEKAIPWATNLLPVVSRM
jgi:hypothetical protein